MSKSYPLPSGWFVTPHEDGSYEIQGPVRETRQGTFPTKHKLYPQWDHSESGVLLRHICGGAVHQATTKQTISQDQIDLLSKVLIKIPELRRISKAARQTGWHSPGLGEVHKDDTDHVIFEVDWAEHEVPLEDSVGDGKQEDADHAAAFNPIVAGQLLDALGVMFTLVGSYLPEDLLNVVKNVHSSLGQPQREDSCSSAL